MSDRDWFSKENVFCPNSSIPHLCPVCCGKGLVPHDFYFIGNGAWGTTTTDTSPVQCRGCGGTGVVR